MGINVNWKGLNLYVVNVYSSCMLLDKRNYWKELIEFKRKLSPREWCICGDFNAVKKERERKDVSK